MTLPLAIEDLQSPQQRRLLDAVDELRNCGLGKELSLPQLVVCGDQSAGKSSVLEALTEIDFPRADNLCTRFATEIILRRAPQEVIKVKIIPDSERPQNEQDTIKAFNHTITSFSSLTTQLGNVINRAKISMGIWDDAGQATARTFARDVLSFEIAGPNRPQLTVVDLPGMIQNEKEVGDKTLVENLTKHYIHQPRTICLAVVNAVNDADNQSILTLVKEADPDGNRSLGIVTKPDLPPPGSGQQQSVIDLCANRIKRYYFKLGWHVLKNRAFEESAVSFAERNRLEAEFFRDSNFNKLRKDSLGIQTLRSRLSNLLFEHVKREIPSIRNEVDKMHKAAIKRLEGLGSSRGDAKECRNYLMQISESVQNRSRCALSGDYGDEYFKIDSISNFDQSSTAAVRRLSAILAKMNLTFDTHVRQNAHALFIGREPKPEEKLEFGRDEDLDAITTGADEPIGIPYKVALSWVSKVMERSRGRELEGNFNPLLISELFWFQSHRWHSIAKDHVVQIAAVCTAFLRELSTVCCAPDVLEKLWDSHLESSLKQRELKALETLDWLMQSLTDHPINFNPDYTGKVQKEKSRRAEARFKYASAAPLKYSYLAPEEKANMHISTCQEALDHMLSIYEVKQEVFIDNVTNLIVHAIIVRGLDKIMSSTWVNNLEDDFAEQLALEPEAVKREREECKEAIRKLEDGQRVLARSIIGVK